MRFRQEDREIKIVQVKENDIVRVVDYGFDYLDGEGNQHSIRFKESLKTREERRRNYIGARKLDQPPWTVQIKGVRFVFASYEDAYRLLLGPLSQFGWRTFDLT